MSRNSPHSEDSPSSGTIFFRLTNEPRPGLGISFDFEDHSAPIVLQDRDGEDYKCIFIRMVIPGYPDACLVPTRWPKTRYKLAEFVAICYHDFLSDVEDSASILPVDAKTRVEDLYIASLIRVDASNILSATVIRKINGKITVL